MLLMHPENKPRLLRRLGERQYHCLQIIFFRDQVQKIDYMNVKVQDQPAASVPSTKKKSNDSKTVQSGSDSLVLENVKHSDKANHQPRNSTSPKSKAVESSGAPLLKCSNKGAHQQSNSQPGKSRPNGLAKSTVVRQNENNGTHYLDNAMVSKQSIQITVSTFSIYLTYKRVFSFSRCSKNLQVFYIGGLAIRLIIRDLGGVKC